MNIKSILYILQIITTCSLVVIILLQARGAGIGSAFGGTDSIYRSKRGVEKLFVYLTVFLTVLFLALAVALVTIN